MRYQQPQVELLPRNNESLAQRLAVSHQNLIAERENKSVKPHGVAFLMNFFERCLRRQATYPLRYLADSAR
jgi:hypothetical protein